MPRAAKLGKHEGQWHSKAGNPSGVYFGSIKVVPFRDAQRRFRAYLDNLGKQKSKPTGITVAELMDRFLAWAEHSRGPGTFGGRRPPLGRFVHFRKGAELLADVVATSVDADDLRDFL